eukprot:1844422-Prymnesium_polylepis.1
MSACASAAFVSSSHRPRWRDILYRASVQSASKVRCCAARPSYQSRALPCARRGAQTDSSSANFFRRRRRFCTSTLRSSGSAGTCAGSAHDGT